MKFLKIAAAIAALSIAGVATQASAAVYTFTLDGSTGSNLGAPPYGTITTSVIANGGLHVIVDLNDDFLFHTSNNNHDAFAFNLGGSPDVNVTNLTAGFTFLADPGSYNESPFGNFAYAIDCNCQQGLGNVLSFDVTRAVGTTQLTWGAILYGETPVYGSSDVIGRGFTGNVGATSEVVINPNSGVPETATWAMMILGMGMVGMGLRLRRRATTIA